MAWRSVGCGRSVRIVYSYLFVSLGDDLYGEWVRRCLPSERKLIWLSIAYLPGVHLKEASALIIEAPGLSGDRRGAPNDSISVGSTELDIFLVIRLTVGNTELVPF